MAASKFKMSDAELLDYMDAATDPNKALDALAVKCRTTRQVMREHLGNLGIVLEDEPAPEKKVLDGFKPVTPAGQQRNGSPAGLAGNARPRKKVGRPVAPMDEIRAMELFNEGLDDLAMAETLGVGVHRVKEWRRRMRLQRLPGRRAAQRETKKLEADAVIKKYKERGTENTVIEESEQRERAFDEILESVDAGKRKPCQPTPEPAGEQAETEPLLTVGGFIQLLMSLTNERTRAVGLVLNGQYVRDIHRLIVDSTSGTLTVEVETC